MFHLAVAREQNFSICRFTTVSHFSNASCLQFSRMRCSLNCEPRTSEALASAARRWYSSRRRWHPRCPYFKSCDAMRSWRMEVQRCKPCSLVSVHEGVVGIPGNLIREGRVGRSQRPDDFGGSEARLARYNACPSRPNPRESCAIQSSCHMSLQKLRKGRAFEKDSHCVPMHKGIQDLGFSSRCKGAGV